MEGVEAELNVLILEHLRSRGYLQSSATLETELQHRKFKPLPIVQSPGLLTKFLLAFERGDRAGFFNLWDQHLPPPLKKSDPTCQSLEFNVSVHFAVYPVKAGAGSGAQAMQDFKAYLENRGAVLAQSQEFAMFCALPYVPDPSKHPTFKTIFTDLWTIELKARLEQFLRLAVSEVSDAPVSGNTRLFSIYTSSKGLRTSSTAVGEVVTLQKKLSDQEQHYEARLMELQTNYHTLVGISMELVETLESSISGQPITSDYIHGLCSRLFGSAVQQGIDLTRPGTTTALLRASVTALTQSVQLPQRPATQQQQQQQQQQQLPQQQQLDYSKMKSDLTRSPNSRKALLLQAIRWRLTRSLAPTRDEALRELVSNDILGCVSPLSECVIGALLRNGDPGVQEQAARLVNAFCSMGMGRAYITQSTHLVRTLCGVVTARLDDTHTQRNVLGSIQKISLKRSLQTLMIDAGLPHWLIEFLKGVESLSDYSLRYALALLMNLTLRTAGKKACIPSGAIILRLLGDLLEYDDTEVCSYVNGILYSLLSVPELRSEGRTLGLGELLGSSIKTSPPEIKSQLKYILGQLGSDSTVLEDSGDDADNEDDEEDPEVIEGDEEDTLTIDDGVTGETLLASEYQVAKPSTLKGPLVCGPKRTHAKLSEVPCTRPVTPLNISNRPYTPLNISNRPYTAAAPISCVSPEMGGRKAARSAK